MFVALCDVFRLWIIFCARVHCCLLFEVRPSILGTLFLFRECVLPFFLFCRVCFAFCCILRSNHDFYIVCPLFHFLSLSLSILSCVHCCLQHFEVIHVPQKQHNYMGLVVSSVLSAAEEVEIGQKKMEGVGWRGRSPAQKKTWKAEKRKAGKAEKHGKRASKQGEN